jgi:hypothetical protein
LSEELCVCAWTRDETTKDPLLCVAGGVGVVKVINTRLQKLVATFSGHGDVYIIKNFLTEGNLRFESVTGPSVYHWHGCKRSYNSIMDFRSTKCNPTDHRYLRR